MKMLYRAIIVLLLCYSAWTVHAFSKIMDNYAYLTTKCLDIAMDSYFIGCMEDKHGIVRGEACKARALEYRKSIQHIFDQVDAKWH